MYLTVFLHRQILSINSYLFYGKPHFQFLISKYSNISIRKNQPPRIYTCLIIIDATNISLLIYPKDYCFRKFM